MFERDVLRLPPARVTTAVVLVVGVGLSLYGWTAPVDLGHDAPADAFSAARAAVHLATIADAPRAPGTSGWARARDYVVTQLSVVGLRPAIEAAAVFGGTQVVYVQNVVATVGDGRPGPGVVLSAHYDSVPNSPGAADDAAGVAALLEVARALQAGGPTVQKVTFLFTDGEESGLAGAEAFAARAPLDSAAVSINFDARGSRGPALMFETGRDPGALLSLLGKVVSRPVATSFMPELYRLLSNDTDFSVFKRAGLLGLNFALVDGVLAYHTATDTTENLSPRSLQHLGESALALSRHAVEPSTVSGQAGPRIYFNAGAWLINYPAQWALVSSVLASGIAVLACMSGVRRRRMTVGGLALGAVMLVAASIAAVLVTMIGWRGLLLLHDDYRALPYGEVYNSGVYRIATSVTAFALTAMVQTMMRRWASIESLWGGVIVSAGLLSLISAWLAPGISYLLTWPAAAGAVALLVVHRAGATLVSPLGAVAVAVCGLSVTLLMLPITWLFYWVFSLGFLAPAVVGIVVLLALLLPQYHALIGVHTRAPVVAALAIVLLCLAVGTVTAGRSPAMPLPSTLIHVNEPATGQSAWMTTSSSLDEWQQTIMGTTPQRVSCEPPLIDRARPCLSTPAAPTSLPPPMIQLLDTREDGDYRVLRLAVRSQRSAPAIHLSFDREVEILSVSSGQVPVVRSQRVRPPGSALRIIAPPPDGLEIECRVRGLGPVGIRIADRTYGLKGLTGFVHRPEWRIPGGRDSDSVFVVAVVSL